ncbi:MAG: hypothetical protein ACHQ2Y_03385 [Candidatus Lutacidiplasmatales archaeon]
MASIRLGRQGILDSNLSVMFPPVIGPGDTTPQAPTTLAYPLTGTRYGLDTQNSGGEPRPLLMIDEAQGYGDDIVHFFELEAGPTMLVVFT